MRCGAAVSQLEPAFYGIPSGPHAGPSYWKDTDPTGKLSDGGIRKLLFLFEVRLLIVAIVRLLFCVEVRPLFQSAQEKGVAQRYEGSNRGAETVTTLEFTPSPVLCKSCTCLSSSSSSLLVSFRASSCFLQEIPPISFREEIRYGS